ncbi:CAP domain-containing protein [Halogeometricum luteum]|uniref:CAP domain-containing protein n=1 Tax=Halogeometricum luteum TaxID=2950537 RepID=A0ABU2G938_9EURY|nr:CAP domain-containing protein [Halogeometricum sp. S3BR5-2]MDS0296648.1 CAP domain-containing protein [Halogeometricum sp. S3BR5-2]
MGARECHYCGTSLEEEGLSTRCNYCRERVCGDHRLPEKHDCPGLYYQKQSTDSTRKSSSRRPSRSRTPPKPTFGQSKKTGQSRPSRTRHASGSSRAAGKTPEKTGMRGPDVNADGSIKPRSHQTPEKPSFDEAGSKSPVVTRRRIIGGLFTTLLGAIGAVQTGVIDSPINLSGVDIPNLNTGGQGGETSGGASTLTTEASETGSDGEGLFGEDLDAQRVQEFVHDAVNARRSEEGVSTLQYSADLQEVAVSHSEDMAEDGYFAHDSPSGETMEDRYEQFGIDCRLSGENIAQTWYKEHVQTDDGEQYYDTNKALAEGIVTQWMNSPGHRENLLRDRFSKEGIGIAVVEVDDGTKVFATQNFCGS